MSYNYNPHRDSSWNYGGSKWKLSRSKIDLFLECPRCFYIDNKLGTKRPPGFPFNINSAVDHLLKQEFDIHRARGDKHPLQREYDIDAVPASHEDIDSWRENFVGVQHTDESTGITVSGAIDDLWVDSSGQYIVVDYKATAKDEPVTNLDEEWHDGYKRQMEVYQWLLRKNGLSVSDTGYFVYCTGRRDVEAFDGKIEFDIRLIPHTGDDSWVGGVIEDIKNVLDSDVIPANSKECDFCAYRKAIKDTLVRKETAMG